MTGGHLPHIQAGIEAITPDPGADLDEELRNQGFNIKSPGSSYDENRDENLKRIELEGKEHPIASGLGTAAGIAGSIAIPVGKLAKGAKLAKGMIGPVTRGADLANKARNGAVAGAALGALQNPGDKEGEVDPLQIGGRLKGAAIGAAIGGAVPVAIQGVSSASQKVSNFLRRKAAGLAETATGATAVKADKFAPGTGRELLDRKIVKFGSSPKGIAKNANAAMEAAEASKLDIINNQLQGTNVDRNKVYNAIRNKINSLQGDESKLDLIKHLEAKLDDITGVANKTSSEVPLSKAEEIRRGFDKAAKWDSMSDAPTREANKIVANAYREAGETAANVANPALGAKFKDDKTVQRLLIPVQEAAEKRALQLKQSPHGGLLDITAGGAGGTIGALIGGPVGAAVGTATGLTAKALRPRYASMAAVTSDALGKKIAAIPGAAGKLNPTVAGVIAQRTGRGTPEFEEQDNSILKNQRLMDLFQKDPSLIESIEDEKTKSLVRRALKLPNRKISSEGDAP